MGEKTQRDWHSGIFDCFEDAKTCCYGFWCCPCLACTVSNGFGENYCLPLCDIFSPAVMVACGIPLFVPPAALSLRSAVRNRHGIKGSLCKDIAVSCFCLWCTWCQMHREMRNLKKTPTVINMQSQAVNAQPAPIKAVSGNLCNQRYQKPQPKMSGIINAGFKAVGNIVENAVEATMGDGMNGGTDCGGMNGGTDCEGIAAGMDYGGMSGGMDFGGMGGGVDFGGMGGGMDFGGMDFGGMF